jgi:hypothetical protein
MLTASLRRKTLLLLLAAVLAAPWASAAGPRTETAQPAQAAEFAPLDVLERLWGLLRNAWTKEGCEINPNGHCTAQPPVQTKEGCHIDPSGLCRP